MQGAGNTRVAGRLAGVVLGMLALSFAAVPFYDWFCRVTGYGGATTTAAAPAGPALAETVTVRFDANVAPGFEASFRPLQRTVEAPIGESILVFYEFANPTDRTIAGTASFNVAPYSTGAYFAKMACFCFELQTLGPGERVEMPVSFFVDPAMLEDREAKGVRAITLSYTMYAAEPSAEATGGVPPIAAAALGDDGAVQN
jgi:cytochrome c oxidase assembly protein subunit 11